MPHFIFQQFKLNLYLIASLLCSQISAQELKGSNFKTVKLGYGIGVELPGSWVIMNEGWKAAIDTFAEAKLDLSGLAESLPDRANLIAVRSMPEETFASIRIDYSRSSEIPDDVRNMSKDKLNRLSEHMKITMVKMLDPQKVLIWGGLELTELSDHPAIVTHYLRTGPNGPVLVWLYDVAIPEASVAFNVSCRASEEELWSPIIERVKKSLSIPKSSNQADLTTSAKTGSVFQNINHGYYWELPNKWDITPSLTKGQHAARLRGDTLMTVVMYSAPENRMTSEELIIYHQRNDKFLFDGIKSKFLTAKFIDSSVVKLDSHEAIQTNFIYSVENQGQSILVFSSMITAIRNGFMYSISFECLKPNEAEAVVLFDDALSKFEFVE